MTEPEFPDSPPALFGVRTGRLRETRVRAAHVKAAARALAEVRESNPDPDPRSEAEAVAAAVVTAEDSHLTDWIVELHTDGGRVFRFGPYRTLRAAELVARGRLPFPGRAACSPLIPAPKQPKRPTTKREGTKR